MRIWNLVILTVALFCTNLITAQTCTCGAVTTFNVNLSSKTDTVWSNTSTRSGLCCGATGTRCIRFLVTVHPQTTEVGFDVQTPSPPGGAFYQVNCGAPTSLGTPLCVQGMTTFCITFCKSGGDSPTYIISASKGYNASKDFTVRENCGGSMFVTGMTEPSITWTSIFPGAQGTYDGYLSCASACDTTTVTPGVGAPAFIDYQVSGNLNGCGAALFVDTIRVYVVPALQVNITPANPVLCAGSPPITLTANVIGGAPPYSYLWNTSSTNQSISVGAAGQYIVSVGDTTLGCPPESDTVTVTTQPAVPAPVATSNSPICEGDSLLLSASTIPGGNYTWSGPSSFSSTSQNPFITPTTLGNAGKYYVSASVNGCPGPADSVTVVINPIPGPPTAGNNGPLCEGATLLLTATGPPGTYNWTGPGSFTSSLQNPSRGPTILAHAGWYYVSVTAGGCSSILDSTLVTINPKPATPVAGSNGPLCAGSILNLTAGGPAGIYSWTGPNSFSSGLQNPTRPGVTALDSGEYIVTVTIGGCTSDPDTVLVDIDDPAIVSAGTNQTICATVGPVPLSGSSSSGSGTWTRSGTGTFTPNPNIFSPSYNPSAADTAAGTVWLYFTSNNNGACAAIVDSILLTFTPNPYAIAGSNQTVCANNVATVLGGAVGNCTGGTWITSGTGTFTPSANILNPTYNPSNADTAAGTVTLTLITTGNGSCPADSSTLIITITPAPIVNAGPNQVVCATQVNVPLAGSVGGPTSTGTWTTPNGTGSFSPNPNTLPGTYLPSPADTTAGTVTLVLTSTGNGNCNAVTDTIILTFISNPAVSTNPNTSVCANNPGVTLNGTSNTGTGIWSSSGTGTFNPNNTTLTATYLPTPADTAAGGVTITLISTNNGTCPADTQTFTITYTNAPVALPGANDTVCANNPNYLLNGAVWNAGGGTWITSGSGTFTPSANVLNPTYNPSPADTTLGTVTLSLITTGIGSCLADTQSMTLVITGAPFLNAGNNIVACLNQPIIPISGTSSTGSGMWGTTGTGTFVPGANLLSTGYQPSSADTAAGSVQLILTTTNVGGCLAVTDTITVTFIQLQVVNAGNDTTMCANNAVLPLSGFVGNGSPTGKWTTSGSGTFSPNDSTLAASYIPSNGDTTAGGYTVYLTSTYGCFPVVDSIVVTITPAPFVNAGPNQTLCNNNPNASLSGIIGGGSATGQWSTSGTGTFTPSNTNLSPTYIPSPADTVAGTITIVLTSTNNGKCLAVTDTVILSFITQPTALAGVDQTVCANDTVFLNGLIINGSGTGIWSTPNGTGNFVPSTTTPSAGYVLSNADTTSGTVTLVWTSTNNGTCLAVTDTMVVTITSAPYANAGNDTSVCANNASFGLNGVIWNANGGRWTSLGTGSFSPHDSSLTAIYTPSAADTAAGFVDLVLRTTGNGTCNPSTDTMRITISPAPNVNAGSTIWICRGDITAPLNGSITGGASTGAWSTLGSGTFTPSNTVLNGTYNLSTADTTAGTVTLILTSTNNGGCLPVTDTVQIMTTTLPAISAGNDTSICSSIDSLQLNGLVIGGSGIGAWTWSGTGTFTPNDTLNNAAYLPSSADTAAGTVVLYFTPTNACRPIYDSIIVTFQSAPAVFAGADFAICDGQLINLSGSQFGGIGTKWLTTGTGSFNPHDSSLTTVYTPSLGDAAAGFVEFILTTGGLALCPGAADTIRVNIGGKPIADFWTTPVCQGQTIQLIDSSTANNGALTGWTYIIGTDTLNAEDTTYLVGASGTISILHIVTSQFGCTDTITKTLTINPLPTSLFTWAAFCDDSVQFTDQSTGGISWNWNFGDSTSSILQSPGHTYPGDSTWYYATLTVTSDSGCVHTYGDTVTLHVGPTADYIPKGGPYVTGTPISFTDQSTGGASYLWDFRDGQSSWSQNPSHTFIQPGDYWVLLTVTDALGCIDTVSYLFTIPDDEGPVAVASGFTPNGDGENDILFVLGGPIENMQFTIYNEWGNALFKSTDQASGWNGKYRGQAQPNGTYVYTLTGELKNGDPVDMIGETNILR